MPFYLKSQEVPGSITGGDSATAIVQAPYRAESASGVVSDWLDYLLYQINRHLVSQEDKGLSLLGLLNIDAQIPQRCFECKLAFLIGNYDALVATCQAGGNERSESGPSFVPVIEIGNPGPNRN
jgi:hypothetical protein